MRIPTLSLVLVLLLAAQASGPAMAANSVTVVSKCVPPGSTGVGISIRIANDVALQQIVLPLEIRESNLGAFISTLAMSYGERLSGVLTDVSVRNQYAVRDGTCGSGNAGYGAISFSDGASHPVGGSPEGVLIARQRFLSPPLAPGADVTGSITLTVNVTGTTGRFVIDTACTTPNNHIWFIDDAGGNIIVPAFQKGTFVIGSCACDNCPCLGDPVCDGLTDVFDVIAIIDVAFSGATCTQDALCPVEPCDFNADHATDVFDVIAAINHAFSGGPGPVNPCVP